VTRPNHEHRPKPRLATRARHGRVGVPLTVVTLALGWLILVLLPG
jgi:hypothetical protein